MVEIILPFGKETVTVGDIPRLLALAVNPIIENPKTTVSFFNKLLPGHERSQCLDDDDMLLLINICEKLPLTPDNGQDVINIFKNEKPVNGGIVCFRPMFGVITGRGGIRLEVLI